MKVDGSVDLVVGRGVGYRFGRGVGNEVDSVVGDKVG